MVADLSHWVNIAETDPSDPDLTKVIEDLASRWKYGARISKEGPSPLLGKKPAKPLPAAHKKKDKRRERREVAIMCFSDMKMRGWSIFQRGLTKKFGFSLFWGWGLHRSGSLETEPEPTKQGRDVFFWNSVQHVKMVNYTNRKIWLELIYKKLPWDIISLHRVYSSIINFFMNKLYCIVK